MKGSQRERKTFLDDFLLDDPLMEIVHIDISYITLKPQAKLVYFFYHALENECSNTILQCGVYIKVETTTSPYNYLYWSSE